jgi:glycosyltransferase involved in cell wall biosynthesis
MRIIHVTNYFRDTHRHVGGAEQAAFRTAMLAREHGCSIRVVTTLPDGSSNPQFPVHPLSVMEDYVPGLVRKYIEAAKWYSVQYDPVAYRGFRSLLAGESADVVHFHNAQFLTLSLLTAALAAGARTVLSIYDYWLFCPTVMLVSTHNGFCRKAHGPWCIDCLPPSLRVFQKALLSVRRRVIDRYLSKVDRFHVLSEHSRSVLEGYGIPPERVHVVPLTLPMDFSDLEPSKAPVVNPSMILFAGWLNERKGLHRLLEAMPLVLERHPESHLTAIGGEVKFGEAYRKKLHDIMEAGRFSDRVTFTGHLPPSQMRPYLEKAAVVVIPEQYENMSPLLMIEAMALGKPVVISRAGGIPEFIEHGVSGWMADPLDAADFAEMIVTVLDDPARAHSMGETGKERILKKLDSEVIWQKTWAMYAS